MLDQPQVHSSHVSQFVQIKDTIDPACTCVYTDANTCARISNLCIFVSGVIMHRRAENDSGDDANKTKELCCCYCGYVCIQCYNKTLINCDEFCTLKPNKNIRKLILEQVDCFFGVKL